MHAVVRSPCDRRAGAILAELVVALLLAGVAAVIGGGILVAAERHTRRDAADDRAGQSVRDASRLLVAEIAAALPDSVALRGDTALDLYAHVGVSVVCARSPGIVVVPAAATSAGIPFSFWRQQPEPADLLVAWDTTGEGQWQSVRIDSALPSPDGAGCGAASGFRTADDSIQRVPVMRLFHSQPIPVAVPPGAPVRVFRPVRWALYRSADRTWALGYRRCPGGECAAAQPVAGPLASPADSGLSFSTSARGLVSVALKPSVASGLARSTVTRTVAVRGAERARP